MARIWHRSWSAPEIGHIFAGGACFLVPLLVNVGHRTIVHTERDHYTNCQPGSDKRTCECSPTKRCRAKVGRRQVGSEREDRRRGGTGRAVNLGEPDSRLPWHLALTGLPAQLAHELMHLP